MVGYNKIFFLHNGFGLAKDARNFFKKEFLADFNIIVLPPISSIYNYFIDNIITRRKCDVKIVYWDEKWDANRKFQNTFSTIKNFLHKFLIKRIGNRCDGYISAGTRSYNYFLSCGFIKSNIFVAYDSSCSQISAEYMDIRSRYNINFESKIILFLGRIIKRKGLQVLINSMHYLKTKNVVVLVCGDGNYKNYCQKLVSKLGLDAIFIFAGSVSSKLKYYYFCQSDVFVLPSIFANGVQEGWGLTVNESLQAGTPVVCSDAVGCSTDIVSGNVGQIAKNNDPFRLAEAIDIVLKHGKKRYTYYCKEQYSKFSVEKMAFEFLNALKQISHEKC